VKESTDQRIYASIGQGGCHAMCLYWIFAQVHSLDYDHNVFLEAYRISVHSGYIQYDGYVAKPLDFFRVISTLTGAPPFCKDLYGSQDPEGTYAIGRYHVGNTMHSMVVSGDKVVYDPYGTPDAPTRRISEYRCFKWC
jgi:hypothetical protein